MFWSSISRLEKVYHYPFLWSTEDRMGLQILLLLLSVSLEINYVMYSKQMSLANLVSLGIYKESSYVLCVWTHKIKFKLDCPRTNKVNPLECTPLAININLSQNQTFKVKEISSTKNC